MKTSDPIVIAVDAAYNIVDGIDGWISETGDFPSNFWKKDVLDRYDRVSDAVNKSAGKVLHPRDQIKLKKKAEDLLDDLIDGLEGVVSEQGEVPDRCWKRNALSKGKTVLRALKRASRVSSLQPLRSRHDYGEDDEKVARELVAVARELTAGKFLPESDEIVEVMERFEDDMKKGFLNMKDIARELLVVAKDVVGGQGLTKEQIAEVKQELVSKGVPVRFLRGGRAVLIESGQEASKGMNVIYQPVYWNFTKETAKKIGEWLGARAVFASKTANVGDVEVIEPVGEGVSKTKQTKRMTTPNAE